MAAYLVGFTKLFNRINKKSKGEILMTTEKIEGQGISFEGGETVTVQQLLDVFNNIEDKGRPITVIVLEDAPPREILGIDHTDDFVSIDDVPDVYLIATPYCF